MPETNVVQRRKRLERMGDGDYKLWMIDYRCGRGEEIVAEEGKNAKFEKSSDEKLKDVFIPNSLH